MQGALTFHNPAVQCIPHPFFSDGQLFTTGFASPILPIQFSARLLLYYTVYTSQPCVRMIEISEGMISFLRGRRERSKHANRSRGWPVGRLGVVHENARRDQEPVGRTRVTQGHPPRSRAGTREQSEQQQKDTVRDTERDSERERESETDRQTDRPTDRPTDSEEARPM